MRNSRKHSAITQGLPPVVDTETVTYTVSLRLKGRRTTAQLSALRTALRKAVANVAAKTDGEVTAFHGPPYDRAGRPLGAKGARLLQLLAETQGSRPHVLTADLCARRPKGSTVPALRMQMARLREHGYVDWERNAADFRERLWSITDAGREYLRKTTQG